MLTCEIFATRLNFDMVCKRGKEMREMDFDWLSDEWRDWLELTPIERFRQSELIFAQYLAMGGSLDPDPDPSSPFYDAETSSTGAAYGRPGLRILRRGAI